MNLILYVWFVIDVDLIAALQKVCQLVFWTEVDEHISSGTRKIVKDQNDVTNVRLYVVVSGLLKTGEKSFREQKNSMKTLL